MKYLDLLGPLPWHEFPERDKNRRWTGPAPMPRAPFVASYLVKVDLGLRSMPRLHEYLTHNPALMWLFGYPLVASSAFSYGFDTQKSLPTDKHMSRILRNLDNEQGQFLLRGSVHLVQNELDGVELPDETTFDVESFGENTSTDTKHILAWVIENNQNVNVEDRFDKTRTLKGDPDCKLGCKDKRNQKKGASGKQGGGSSQETGGQATQIPVKKTHDGSEKTPKQEGMMGSKTRPGTYYWGYKTGVTATKVPFWGEFVLAEETDTFNVNDVLFFKPLMAKTELVLGKAPKNGAYDAAFDAYYVYEYHHLAGGTAYAPLKSDHYARIFDKDGTPICDAGEPYHLQRTYMKTANASYPHRIECYNCPLLKPEQTATSCPVNHEKWAKGGCETRIPESIGTRIRYQLDRESKEYKDAYNERTATERVNSQAKELGIERPKLRNKHSVTNQNTLIYVLINMRALARIKEKKQGLADGSISMPEPK